MSAQNSRVTAPNTLYIILGLTLLFAGFPPLLADEPAIQWQWSGRDRDERLSGAPQFHSLTQHPLGSRLLASARESATQALDYLSPSLSESLVAAVADADTSWSLWLNAEGGIRGHAVAVRGNATANDMIETAARDWAARCPECALAPLSGGGENDWSLTPKSGEWSLFRLNDWTLLEWGEAQEESALEGILKTGAPLGWGEEGYLRLGMRMDALFPHASGPLPRFQGVWRVESGKARTRGTFVFPEPILTSEDDLRIPNEVIKDPISSFAVFRGLDALFPKAATKLGELGLPDVLQELYVWSEDHGWTLPYVTHFAAPAKDARAAVQELANQIQEPANSALAGWGLGGLERIDDPVQIHWKNLPMVLPFIRAVDQGDQPYVTGGFFPLEQHTDPAPEALLQQVRDRPDLRAYHWEITPLRFSQIARLQSIGNVLVQVARASESEEETLFAPPLDWTPLAEPFSEGFSNAITEIVAITPTEWELTRTSGLGFIAAEWNLALIWLQQQGAFTTTEATPHTPPAP